MSSSEIELSFMEMILKRMLCSVLLSNICFYLVSLSFLSGRDEKHTKSLVQIGGTAKGFGETNELRIKMSSTDRPTKLYNLGIKGIPSSLFAEPRLGL
jgi:hypothetical protein